MLSFNRKIIKKQTPDIFKKYYTNFVSLNANSYDDKTLQIIKNIENTNIPKIVKYKNTGGISYDFSKKKQTNSNNDGGSSVNISFTEMYSFYSTHILATSSVLVMFIYLTILFYSMLKDNYGFPSDEFDIGEFVQPFYYLCNTIKELLIIFFSINILASSIILMYKLIDTVVEPANKIALYILFGAIQLLILYFAYTTVVNLIYRFKLQGIIFPGVVIGTGIGLSIVKKIINLYEGDIWIDSEIGKGTIFYFTIKK